MLCGGVTVFSPLRQYGAGGEKAKDVGIVGIGGLGHFGLLFAKALGANVTAISHSESKKADAEKMGATRFIATHSGKDDDFAPYKRSLDLIICTTNDKDMPLLGYLSLLRPGGNLIREFPCRSPSRCGDPADTGMLCIKSSVRRRSHSPRSRHSRSSWATYTSAVPVSHYIP